MLRVEMLNESLGIRDLGATSLVAMKGEIEGTLITQTIAHEKGVVEVEGVGKVKVEGGGKWTMLEVLEDLWVVDGTRSCTVGRGVVNMSCADVLHHIECVE